MNPRLLRVCKARAVALCHSCGAARPASGVHYPSIIGIRYILDMGAQTFEGVVEHGRIRLNSEVHIPEGAKVYVLVPGMEAEPGPVHLRSPRLARPEQAADFEMEVVQP